MGRQLFLSLVLAGCMGGLCTACSKSRAVATIQPPADSTAPALRYLALGDSYTIGQGVQPEERFPYLTVRRLRNEGVNMADPQYIATTGWTTGQLQSAIGAATLPAAFDVVSLLIGVNDQYQGQDTAGYRTRFTQLLLKAIELAGNRRHRVFVLSIPDYSATPFVAQPNKARVSTEISWFNAINRQVTDGQQVAYIDITPLTRVAAGDPSLLAPDGLHYSGKAHQQWADLLAPLVKAVVF